MNITSEDEALLELFENGKTSDKKYGSIIITEIELIEISHHYD